MRAAIIDKAGAGFRIAEIEKPALRPGEVLVRLSAAGLNPLDGKIRAGNAPHAHQPFPAVLGIDGAGIVEAAGEGARFRPGDEVFGMIGGVGGHQGTLAEFIAVPEAPLAKKPTALDMRQAAALPLVFITAWEGLMDRAMLQAGQSVLVLGGAGGVGQMAVQLAHLEDDRPVFATGSSARSRAIIEGFGATFIDRALAVSDMVAKHTAGRGFDVVFDTAGGASLDAAFNAVARFGHVVSSLGWGSHVLAPLSFKAATYSGIFTLLTLLTGEDLARHGKIMANAAQLADAGKLVPGLDPRRFALSDIGKAFDALTDGSAQGKIVVDIG